MQFNVPLLAVFMALITFVNAAPTTHTLLPRVAANPELACRAPKNGNKSNGDSCRFMNGSQEISGHCRKPYGVKDLTCHTDAELADKSVNWEPAAGKSLIG